MRIRHHGTGSDWNDRLARTRARVGLDLDNMGEEEEEEGMGRPTKDGTPLFRKIAHTRPKNGARLWSARLMQPLERGRVETIPTVYGDFSLNTSLTRVDILRSR